MKKELIEEARMIGFMFESAILTNEGLDEDEAYYLWLCLLQRFLRTSHKIEVEVFKTMRSEPRQIQYGVQADDWSDNTISVKHLFHFHEKTHEESLEKGLIEAIKTI